MDYDFEQACRAHGIHTKPHSDDESDGGKSDFDDIYEQHKPDSISLLDLTGRIVKIEPTLHTSSSGSKATNDGLEHLPNVEVANAFCMLSVNDRDEKEYPFDEKPKIDESILVKVEMNDEIITVHERETFKSATNYEGGEWQIKTPKRSKKIASSKESKGKLDIYERAAHLQPTLRLSDAASLTVHKFATQGGNADQKQVIESPAKNSIKKKKKKKVSKKGKVDVYEKTLQDVRGGSSSVESQSNHANLTQNTFKKEEKESSGKIENNDLYERLTFLQSRKDQTQHINLASVVRDALFLSTKSCKSDTQDFTTVFKVPKMIRKTLESVANINEDETQSVSLTLGGKAIPHKLQINNDKQKHIVNSPGCSKELTVSEMEQISDQKRKITEDVDSISQDHVDPCHALCISTKSYSNNLGEKDICTSNNPTEAIENSKQKMAAIKNVPSNYQGEKQKNEGQDQIHVSDCPELASKRKKKKALKSVGEDNQVQFADTLRIGQIFSLLQGHVEDVNNGEKRKCECQEQVYVSDCWEPIVKSKALERKEMKPLKAAEKNNKLQFSNIRMEQVSALSQEHLSVVNRSEKRKIEGQDQVQVSGCQELTAVKKASKRRQQKGTKEDNKIPLADTLNLEQSYSLSQAHFENVNMDGKQSENKGQVFTSDNRCQQPNVASRTFKQKNKKVSKFVEINNMEQDGIDNTYMQASISSSIAIATTDENLEQIFAKQEENLGVNLNATQDQDSRQSTATVSIASKRRKKKKSLNRSCITNLLNYHVEREKSANNDQVKLRDNYSQQPTMIKSKASKRKKKKAPLKATQENNGGRDDRSLPNVKPSNALKCSLDVTKHEEKTLTASSNKNSDARTYSNNTLDSQRKKQLKPIKASILFKEEREQLPTSNNGQVGVSAAEKLLEALKNKNISEKLELASKRSKESIVTPVRRPLMQQKKKKLPTLTASKLSKQKRNTLEFEEIERLKRHFSKMQSLVDSFASNSPTKANHNNNSKSPGVQGTNLCVQVGKIRAVKEHLNQMQLMFDILTLTGKQNKVLKAKTGRTQLALTRKRDV